MRAAKAIALASAVCAAPLFSFGYGEFGPIDEARAAHPECFATGVVWSVVHEGVSWTTFCGLAVKDLENEEDAELYDEAETAAKLAFYEAVKKRENDPRARVSIVRGRRMYRFKDGKNRYVVYGAKTADIEVARPLSVGGPPPGR